MYKNPSSFVLISHHGTQTSSEEICQWHKAETLQQRGEKKIWGGATRERGQKTVIRNVNLQC